MNSSVQSIIPESWQAQLLHRRLTYVAIAALLLVIEYLTGELIEFPITFVIPVILASWFCAPHIGYSFAIGMAVVRLSFDFVWDSPSILRSMVIINGIINAGVLLFIAFITGKAFRLTREVKLLHGILPTCCFCKKIRDQDNKWRAIEVYIEKRTDAQFSHGICPECAELHYGDVLHKNHPKPNPAFDTQASPTAAPAKSVASDA